MPEPGDALSGLAAPSAARTQAAEPKTTVRPFKAAPLVAAAFAAAVAGYTLHHLSWLQGHGAAVASAVVILALACGLLVARMVRPAPTTTQVLVAQPGTTAVRRARPEEMDLLMAVHREALGHGFLTRLGPRFLRAYAATFAESAYAVALVSTLSGAPVGALTGVIAPSAHTRWTLRHRGLRLLLLAAGGLAVRPGTAFYFLRTRLGRYTGAWRRHRSADDKAPAQGPVAVLSHVAVLPGARGTGAGKLLVEEFVASAAAAGVSRVILETRAGPESAGGFYSRLGWQRVHDAEPGQMETWAIDATHADA